MNDVRTHTAALYDDLWNRFNRDDFEFALAESEGYYKLPGEAVKGKRCLDAGCGVGFFVTRLFRAGAAEVCAIDIGKKNIANTRHWNEAWKDKLTVREQSVLDLDFPASSFDFVHCNGVLHHTEDPERGFRNLVNVTKSGGRTVIGVYGAGGLMPLSIGILRKVVKVLPYRLVSSLIARLFPKPYDQYLILDFLFVPIVNRYREDEIREWFKKSGYRDIVRSRIHTRYRHGSFFAKLMHGEGYITMEGIKN